jgi:hypothetical protein
MTRPLLPLAAFTAATALLGVYLGEDLREALPGAAAGWAAVGCLLPLLHRSRPLLHRLSLSAALLLSLCAGWLLGRAHASRCFNELVTHGEVVREALHQHHLTTGAYPPTLAALEVELPGRRWLRGSLLRYRPTEAGYALQFSDGLVVHSASESAPFSASK